MGRSFRSVRVGAKLPEFSGATFSHAPSREQFTAVERDGRSLVRRSQQGPDGTPVNVFEERVDYTIGSGNHAISYLHRKRDGKLIEFPVTWYAENGGHWGMSPAYDRPDHAGFSRVIAFRCMFCHNAYPDLAPAAGDWDGDWDGATDFPAALPEGIDCQRCHGSGLKHIDAAHAGKSAPEIRAAIVNPARLSPDRQLEICMQCHLETTSLPLPGAIARFGRGVFSFRPGEPLSDYMLYFDHAPGTGHDDKFELVSAAYRFRQSRCFEASEGRLTCTTCHDPHRAPSWAESVAKTNRVCAGCHAAIAGVSGHAAGPDCVSCHMPLRAASDAVHIEITDHRIARKLPLPAQPLAEQHDGNTLPYAGAIVPYYPRQSDPLYTALAQVQQFAGGPAALRDLARLISADRSVPSDMYFELAEALLDAGQAASSLSFYEEASKRSPDNWRYFYGLARASRAAGKLEPALTALQRAIGLAPSETSLLQLLGSLYAGSGRLPEAVGVFQKAIDTDPESAAAFNNLGSALLRSGDARGAETALREAVRLQPELPALRASLADALARNGRMREAAFELREAIRTGPSTEAARAAWVAALVATGSVESARAGYDRSLRMQASGAHNNLGTIYISMGDATAAVREYRLAVDADPGSARALLNLGFTLAQHGDQAEAQRRLGEALRIDSSVAADLRRAAESPDPRVSAVAGEVLRGANTRLLYTPH
jgi:predicted CXXCH cytochrome family protein